MGLLSGIATRFQAADDFISGWKPLKGKKNLRTTYGAVGTLNFEGYLTDLDEYNSDFQVNAKAMRIYNEMRIGDPQVYATLCALSLPVMSAKWSLSAPDDSPNSIEKEAAELVKQNLFGGLEYTSPMGMTVSQPFSEILQHGLLMLAFGSMVMEELWAVDGNRIRLTRLDPRMPRTYFRWHVDDDGSTLIALEQIAYRGPNMQFWTTPADKLTIFSFQKEGAYFAGRPILRSMYKPWFFKNGLEQIDAVRAERNGLGIPVITHAPNAAKEDRDLANQWVTQIAAHQAIGLGVPNGADFKLVGVQGAVYDLNKSIQRYAMDISRVGLASFINLGSTATGSKAVGGTLSDFFLLSEQALADQIAWALNVHAIRRLVDFNFPGKFGRGKLRYPQLSAANVRARLLKEVIAVLDKLALAGYVRPDVPLESWMRQEMGFPAADPATARLQQQTKVTITDKTSSNPTPAPGGSTENAAATPSAAPEAQPTTEAPDEHSVVSAEPNNLSARAARPRLRRKPRGVEVHVPHDAMLAKLERGKKSVARVLRSAKERQMHELAQRISRTPRAEIHRVSLPLDRDLAAAVKKHLHAIASFGAETVRHERIMQKRHHGTPAKPQLEKVSMSGPGQQTPMNEEPIGLLADTTVQQFQNNLAARMAAAALKNQAAAAQHPDDLVDAMDDQADGWIDRGAGEGVNGAMATGRQQEFQKVRSEIDRFIYSSMLDQNTCDDCAAADGQEGTEDQIPEVPNPGCSGGELCRCMWVAVFSDEGEKA